MELQQHDPDILCLEEVDHYEDMASFLGPHYQGIFYPKPASPCLESSPNNGSDGCGLFYKPRHMTLVECKKTRLRNDDGSIANQVAIIAKFHLHKIGKQICVAVTHLKAKKPNSEARLAQGTYLLKEATKFAAKDPLVICGDFNAEEAEPVYTLYSNSPTMASAYMTALGHEPPFTTWKLRETGEAKHTIDYIWYSRDSLKVEGILATPSCDELGQYGLPSHTYPSDHLSLCADITILQSTKYKTLGITVVLAAMVIVTLLWIM